MSARAIPSKEQNQAAADNPQSKLGQMNVLFNCGGPTYFFNPLSEIFDTKPHFTDIALPAYILRVDKISSHMGKETNRNSVALPVSLKILSQQTQVGKLALAGRMELDEPHLIKTSPQKSYTQAQLTLNLLNCFSGHAPLLLRATGFDPTLKEQEQYCDNDTYIQCMSALQKALAKQLKMQETNPFSAIQEEEEEEEEEDSHESLNSIGTHESAGNLDTESEGRAGSPNLNQDRTVKLHAGRHAITTLMKVADLSNRRRISIERYIQSTSLDSLPTDTTTNERSYITARHALQVLSAINLGVVNNDTQPGNAVLLAGNSIRLIDTSTSTTLPKGTNLEEHLHNTDIDPGVMTLIQTLHDLLPKKDEPNPADKAQRFEIFKMLATMLAEQSGDNTFFAENGPIHCMCDAFKKNPELIRLKAESRRVLGNDQRELLEFTLSQVQEQLPELQLSAGVTLSGNQLSSPQWIPLVTLLLQTATGRSVPENPESRPFTPNDAYAATLQLAGDLLPEANRNPHDKSLFHHLSQLEQDRQTTYPLPMQEGNPQIIDAQKAKEYCLAALQELTLHQQWDDDGVAASTLLNTCIKAVNSAIALEQEQEKEALLLVIATNKTMLNYIATNNAILLTLFDDLGQKLTECGITGDAQHYYFIQRDIAQFADSFLHPTENVGACANYSDHTKQAKGLLSNLKTLAEHCKNPDSNFKEGTRAYFSNLSKKGMHGVTQTPPEFEKHRRRDSIELKKGWVRALIIISSLLLGILPAIIAGIVIAFSDKTQRMKQADRLRNRTTSLLKQHSPAEQSTELQPATLSSSSQAIQGLEASISNLTLQQQDPTTMSQFPKLPNDQLDHPTEAYAAGAESEPVVYQQ